ncbi:phosphatidylinositol-specific phospholipase C domain-containing protein [Kitasatospora sp. NPDC088391]|uniref:phosphatidylinositol-specific phospholipase C domain-containing protein n=1 Tax=Kitasatospora sp. NPDC088391 TaxID=3364074 RepID=UPI00380F4574
MSDAFSNLSASAPDWMGKVPEQTSLAQMSIPGTHETLAIHGGSYVQAQNDYGDSAQTLAKQLDAGIRAIDVRMRVVEGNKFAIHHGLYYQVANFDDVLRQAQTFLRNHPTETVMLRLKAECTEQAGSCTDDTTHLVPAPCSLERPVGCYDSVPTPIDNGCVHNWVPDDVTDGHADNGARTEARHLAILCGYLHDPQYQGLFYQQDSLVSIASGASANLSSVTRNAFDTPTLKDARGHIVLTDYRGPFGGDYGVGLTGFAVNSPAPCASTTAGNDSSCLEDNWNNPTLGDKVASVKANLRQAARSDADLPNNSKGLYTTYTSAAGTFLIGTTPFTYAGGGDGPPGSPGVNTQLAQYLEGPDVAAGARLGLVMMDFPGWALINDIVNHNPSVDGQPPGGVPTTPTTPPVVIGGVPFAGAPEYSLENAYDFLKRDMDAYGCNDELRVPQSYQGGYFSGPSFGPDGYQASFTYDNALVIMALLQRGTSSDLSYATVLGNTLRYAQEHDPETADGRLRASYEPNPFITRSGAPYVGGYSVYTGNMAWAGMAFTRLYKATGNGDFLDSAKKIGTWIQTHAADSRGAGGYTGGLRYGDDLSAGGTQLLWKATEHNIDTGAFFTMLGSVTGDPAWSSHAADAFHFVASMKAADGHLWTGTGTDGVSLNQDFVPEDVQAWSYLATLDPAYSPAVDWAATHTAATDGEFTGVSFSPVDVSKVWFEGTAHMLAAYHARHADGDAAKANVLLDTLLKAQADAPHSNGRGIDAASGDGLITGDGDTYYAALHTGATAWYLIAAQGGNPFRL